MDFEDLLAWPEQHRLPDAWLLVNWKTMEKPDDVTRRQSLILNEEGKLGVGLALRSPLKMRACQSARACSK